MSSAFELPPPPPPVTEEGVAAEIEAEIQGQVGPLETAAEGYSNAELRAIEQLNALYGDVMPFVQGSAQRVAEMYGASTQAQQGIFNQAFNRLNAIRGERAADAQALAQQLGAPIPIDMFTEATDVERGAATAEFAGGLLQAQGLAQAGVQEAEAFAGRVFPLQRTRLETETRKYYRDKIWELNQQIAQIKGMKKGMINERLRTRMLEDYQLRLDRVRTEYDMWQAQKGLSLQEKQFAFQKKESIRNWKLAMRQEARALKDMMFQQKMSKKAFQLELKRFKAQVKQFAEQMGLSYDELAQDLKIAELNAAASGSSDKAKNQLYIRQKREQITVIADTILSGVPAKTKTVPVKDETGKVIGYETIIDQPAVPGMGGAGPMKVLRTILAKAGVTENQKVLYQWAIKQVILSYKAAGYVEIPTDPTKWNAWWKRRSRQGQRGTGPVSDAGTPGGPGGRRY